MRVYERERIRREWLKRAHKRDGGAAYGHGEAVTETGRRVGELVRKLDVVMVEPASINLSDTIKAGDGCLAEEGGEELETRNKTNEVSAAVS